MDILTIIFIIVTICLILYIVFVPKEKRINITNDILFAVKALDLTVEIINELQLFKENKIKIIVEIIVNAIEFVEVYDDGTIILEEVAYKYVEEQCQVLNIEITEQRKIIIIELINILLEKANL